MQSQQIYFTGTNKLDDAVILAYGSNFDITIGRSVEIHKSYDIDDSIRRAVGASPLPARSIASVWRIYISHVDTKTYKNSARGSMLKPD
jgi:hypothetical protein